MLLTLERYKRNELSTVSRLYIDGNPAKIEFLEDVERELVDFNKDGDFNDLGEGKIWGETAIPKGTYKLKLRTDMGSRHNRFYYSKYGKKHKGMIWLDNVPGFEYIYIHIGNFVKDTHGCLLPGLYSVYNEKTKAFEVRNSTKAYWKIYPLITKKMLNNENVFIEIK